MTNEEYVAYLGRLKQLIYVELITKVATFDYLSNHTAGFGEDPMQVEPLLWPIVSGLRFDVTFSLHRLVYPGNSDRNIIHFLNVTMNDYKSIKWSIAFPKSRIQEFQREWNDRSHVIDRLTRRRNKFFAHYDKDHFYDPDVSLEAIPFTVEDAKDLTRLLQRTVSFFHYHLHGTGLISMEGFVYAAAEKLYGRMRRDARDADRHIP